MKIVKQRKSERQVTYTRVFTLEGRSYGDGWGFECHEDGTIKLPLTAQSITNYMACIDGTYDIAYDSIERLEIWHVEPAIGVCSCNATVTLHSFTNVCAACGTSYGLNGNVLAPKSLWERSTRSTPTKKIFDLEFGGG